MNAGGELIFFAGQNEGYSICMFGNDSSVEQDVGKLIGSRIATRIGFIDSDFGFTKADIELLG